VITVTQERRWLTAVGLALTLAYLGTVGAQPAPEALDAQLETAIQHAGFARQAGDHESAQRHLGHVLNCIVGEGNEGFDAGWGHPCGGLGQGIVVDATAHPDYADLALLLRSVETLAREGVEAGTVGGVQAAAAGVQALLNVIVELGG
jgi:hypothetical protein